MCRSLERVTAVLNFFHLGWMMLVVVLPLGSGQAGGSQIILLDRTPFYAPSTMTILPRAVGAVVQSVDAAAYRDPRRVWAGREMRLCLRTSSSR